MDITLNRQTPTADTKADPLATVKLDGLGPGTYTFSLTVTDDLGLTSAPATTTVIVRGVPNAKITGPRAVAVGQPIPLSGDGSTGDGPITYTWTLVNG